MRIIWEISSFMIIVKIKQSNANSWRLSVNEEDVHSKTLNFHWKVTTETLCIKWWYIRRYIFFSQFILDFLYLSQKEKEIVHLDVQGIRSKNISLSKIILSEKLGIEHSRQCSSQYRTPQRLSKITSLCIKFLIAACPIRVKRCVPC